MALFNYSSESHEIQSTTRLERVFQFAILAFFKKAETLGISLLWLLLYSNQQDTPNSQSFWTYFVQFMAIIGVILRLLEFLGVEL